MPDALQVTQTLQKRVEKLEKQFAELRAQVLGVKPRLKNWQKTAGTFPRDELTLEAERIGREWRNQQANP